MHGYSQFARHYDALTENVEYRGRAIYFDRIIKQNMEGGDLLLDLACGTGSLSLELAKMGYEVIGVDGSGEMLSVALPKASAAGQNILFLCQTMEKLDLYGTVDACVCALDSLNHLPDTAAVDRAFARLALFIRPGGLFIFDVNTAYKHRHVLGDNVFVYDLPEVYCVWQNRYSGAENHRVDISLDFFIPDEAGGYRRESERFSERIFSGEVLEALLQKNKMEIVQVYGDDTTEPAHKESQRLVYIARRKED